MGHDYFTPFIVQLYKCFDNTCSTCDFDLPNFLTGSLLCTSCPLNQIWDKVQKNCTYCGNGKVDSGQGESCDDQAKGGCNALCTNSNTNFTCTGGSSTAPSVCVCQTGFLLNGSLCLPVCGDGKKVGSEACDDNKSGGCKDDCSAPVTNYTCSGGSSTAPSICTCKPGYTM